MNLLWRSIAIMFLASLAIGCGGGSGTTTELTPEQQDPNAAAEEAKRLMGAGGMTPGPIKQGPAGKK